MKGIFNKIRNLEMYKKWWFWLSLTILIFCGAYVNPLKQTTYTQKTNNMATQIITTSPTPTSTVKPTPSNNPTPQDTPTPSPTTVPTTVQSTPNPTPKPTPVSTPKSTAVQTPNPVQKTNIPNSNSGGSISGSSSSSNQHVTVENNKIDGVWIGETGTKYHNKNCRTLKGNKYEISLDEAKAQGRQPCKVCH